MISEDQLVESRTFLSNTAFWPEPGRLDLGGWLQNFEEGPDRLLAAALLESMVHINEKQIVHGTLSGIRALSALPEFGPAEQRQDSWNQFLDAAFFSFPSGSEGDATGSGHIFARIVKSAGIPEKQIMSSDDLVRLIARKPQVAPVIFLDDLAASGTQFKRTWTRQVMTDSGKKSLKSLSADRLIGAAYYIPIAATQEAIQLLRQEAAEVQIRPVYLVEADYSATHEATRLVPPSMRPHLEQFLLKYSPATGRDEYGPFGYKSIGLALSFHHSTPNNTVPILQNGSIDTPATWRPLIS